MAVMISDLWAEEILCRVPAISLKRLQSTCKGWNSLFSDSRFTRKHLEKATKQFLVFMLNDGRICSMSVNLQGIQSVEVTRELSLIDPRYSLLQEQLEIYQVFHCDGLLLCTESEDRLSVVWNPLTGQTKRIQPRTGDKTSDRYALGSYQDKESCVTSYKILSFGENQGFEICDINNSESWRTLDITPNCHLVYQSCGASLKGKTYWIASQETEKQSSGIFLVSFDYTRETFERLAGHIPIVMDDQVVALSVVREEKLAVLLKPEESSKTEIWLTNKIDDATKEISWNKVLAVDLSPYLQSSYGVSFLLDEEKKVLVLCDNEDFKTMVYIVGEDNRIRRVSLGEPDSWPFLFTYVPSLTQI